MELDRGTIARIAREFGELELGDPRRSRRVHEFVTALAKHPGAALPSAMGSEAALEAAYRLMNNPHFDFDDLLAEHRDRTVERARAAGDVLVLHDTTQCSFEHADPRDVGFLPTGKAGFFVHTSLVLDAQRLRRPLGVLHVEPYWRSARSGRGSRKRHVSGKETAAWSGRESERWGRAVQECEEQLGDCSAIHVMDREGDKYELFAQMSEHQQRFVVRLRGNRRLWRDADALSLRQRMETQPVLLSSEVHVSRRKAPTAPRSKRLTPERPARDAQLHVTCAAVTLRRPNNLPLTITKTLDIHVVHVFEPAPPPNQDPIDWTLLTSEPIDTVEQIQRVIGIYRQRWVIEELFKALKSGCQIEKRQFESRHALLNILALSLPIAVEILWVRSRVEHDPNAPASDIVTHEQLEVLTALGSRNLPPNPTAADVLLAIAAMGGHLKRNGPPGWAVLHRGYERLVDYTTAWTARGREAHKRPRRNL